MSLSRDILTAHSLTGAPAKVGETLRVAIDWILASELALAGMDATYQSIGRPPLWNPESFFLAIDHTVDPHTIRYDARTKQLVRLSRQFAELHKLPAFYDANTAIMHTAFYRNHCIPGSVVVGADSHTTSHGALGAFSIGLGGADVAVASVTGHTWISVPEEILVRYRGSLPRGVTGKDVVLETLSRLGCNRHALERSIEFETCDTEFSPDTRFAICNMAAEMGAINGIFRPISEADLFLSGTGQSPEQFAKFLASSDPSSFQATFDINLSKLTPKVAIPYSPDNVCDVTSVAGRPLDGCFIGACTTTEEDLVLAALVLEQMQKQGVEPVESSKRLVIPGDTGIKKKLAEAGILEIYTRAGFRVGLPGCHMCLGLGTERAGRGEVWLSSQNRNFKNRMGVGSDAFLASALTVAASSAAMKVTDPRMYLEGVDLTKYAEVCGAERPFPIQTTRPLPAHPTPQAPSEQQAERPIPKQKGRALVFGNNVDTDAIIPGEFCSLTDPTELGQKCFAHVRPEVPKLAKEGSNIVVAGTGWGCGSSREHAAWALRGAGIKAIVAKSIAAIHKRNLINEGIPLIIIKSPDFYQIIKEGDYLTIDAQTAQVHHKSSGITFQGERLTQIESSLLQSGGLVKYMKLSFGVEVG